MASGPVALDRPPMLPPDVGGQMGAGGGGDNPLAGIGQMMADKAKQGAGAPQPDGSLTAQADAVEKVVSQMSRMSDAFAPFGAKILDMLKTGIAEATRAGQGGGKQAPPPGGPGAPPPPATAGAGPGFPG